MADADPWTARPDHDGYDREAVLRVYDAMAADYAVTYGGELREPDSDTEFLDAALADLPAGPVLDVGCGPAQVSRYLVDHGRAAIGIDLAPGMLAAAARRVPSARLVAADLLALPLRHASCAGAVASYSLHHLPRGRLGAALAGLRAVLRPGGVLVVITHGGDSEEWLDRRERPGAGTGQQPAAQAGRVPRRQGQDQRPARLAPTRPAKRLRARAALSAGASWLMLVG